MSGGGGGAAEAKAVTPPPRQTIGLPPARSTSESLFGGAADVSPGPTALGSSFFNDDPDGGWPSFSQLLTGVVASPVAAAQQRRPPSSAVSRRESMSPFTVLPPPAIFSPNSGPGGISHQQSLAQVTSQDAQSHSQMHNLPEAFNNSFGSGCTSHCNQRPQPASLIIDKPADDGYNWRKYGQKQVKGGKYPRSYYKCTHPSCPVTKKVERSLEGQVTEIIYKGQHNHQKPPRHSKESNELTGNLDCANNADSTGSKKESEFGHGTSEQLPGSSDDEEGDAGSKPEPKKRAVDVRETEPTSSHRMVTEPRIIVQTTSEVDLLDDGFRWRKYGQKVVKGNPYPRSYYRCTSAGCNVRKQVERASTDPKEVITAYEGKHNHEIPAARNSSHNTANSIAAADILHPKVHNPIPSHQSFFERGDLRNNVSLASCSSPAERTRHALS